MFCTMFHLDFKIVSTQKNSSQGGLYDQKVKMSFVIKVEKRSFREKATKIYDIVCTPNHVGMFLG